VSTADKEAREIVDELVKILEQRRKFGYGAVDLLKKN
jgi:hypothetical protein